MADVDLLLEHFRVQLPVVLLFLRSVHTVEVDCHIASVVLTALKNEFIFRCTGATKTGQLDCYTSTACLLSVAY